MMPITQMNRVHGVGMLFFDLFLPGTVTSTGLRYFGNTTKFTVGNTVASETAYGSKGDVISKSSSVVTRMDVTGKFTTDNINVDNVTKFFMGDRSDVARPKYSNVHTFTAVAGCYYQLGQTTSNLLGHSNVDECVFSAAGVVSPQPLIDYEIDTETGIVGIPYGSKLAGKLVTCSYVLTGYFSTQVMSASRSIQGALRFVPKTVVGRGLPAFLPYVSLRPSGDYDFKSNVWQEMSFQFDAMLDLPVSSVFNSNIAGL